MSIGDAEIEIPREAVEAVRNEFAKLLIELRERRQRGTGEGDPVKVAIEVRETAEKAIDRFLSEMQFEVEETRETGKPLRRHVFRSAWQPVES